MGLRDTSQPLPESRATARLSACRSRFSPGTASGRRRTQKPGTHRRSCPRSCPQRLGSHLRQPDHTGRDAKGGHAHACGGLVLLRWVLPALEGCTGGDQGGARGSVAARDGGDLGRVPTAVEDVDAIAAEITRRRSPIAGTGVRAPGRSRGCLTRAAPSRPGGLRRKSLPPAAAAALVDGRSGGRLRSRHAARRRSTALSARVPNQTTPREGVSCP